MTKYRQSPSAMMLMSVAAFIATTWASTAVAGERARKIQELSDKGPAYTVFRNQANRPEHEAAIVAVVQTREAPGIVHGLVFLQARQLGHIGKGMVCEHSDPRPSRANLDGNDKAPSDMSLECHQHVGDVKETLRVGAIDSEFCNDLRDEVRAIAEKDPEKMKSLYTRADELDVQKNPIVTKEECEAQVGLDGQCVCYQIDHEGPQDFPPSSGTGSGGHG